MKISAPSPARALNRTKKVVVNLNDMSLETDASLILWDDQINLIKLFKRGDFLALFCPYISPSWDASNSSNCILEYGSATILFCLPQKNSQVI